MRGSPCNRYARQPLDGGPVRELDRLGLVGPGRHHHGGHRQPRRLRGLDGQERVVDRPEAGPCRHQERMGQVDSQVANEVAGREWDEQASHSLADEGLGGRGGRAGPLHELSRLEGHARQLGCVVGRDGRSEHVGRHVLGSPAGDSSEELVVARPLVDLLVEARDDGFEGRYGPPLAESRADRPGDNGLADTGVGAGDEEARQRRGARRTPASRRRPRARSRREAPPRASEPLRAARCACARP